MAALCVGAAVWTSAALAVLSLLAGVGLSRLARVDLVERLRSEPPASIRVLGDSTPLLQDIEIHDATGVARARLRFPDPSRRRLAAVVVLGGLGAGRQAVHLVDSEQPFVLASLDYAYVGPQRMSAVGFIARLPILWRDLVRTSRAFRDLIRFVRDHPRVDPERVFVVGASLGAPLATAAAAVDPPSGVVILYGFANHRALIEARLEPWVRWGALRRPLAACGAQLTAAFEVTQSLPQLCGTPILVVTSPEDTDLPAECVDAVWEATCSPRWRVELPGGHIRGARKPQVLQRVVGVIGDWIDGLGSQLEEAR